MHRRSTYTRSEKACSVGQEAANHWWSWLAVSLLLLGTRLKFIVKTFISQCGRFFYSPHNFALLLVIWLLSTPLWSMGVRTALSADNGDSAAAAVSHAPYLSQPTSLSPQKSTETVKRFLLALTSEPSEDDLAILRRQYGFTDLIPLSNINSNNVWVASVDMASALSAENTAGAIASETDPVSTNGMTSADGVVAASVWASAFAAQMTQSALIAYAEPEIFFTAFDINRNNGIGSVSAAPNDVHYSEQWALDAIRATEAWQLTTGDNDITIAVLDSGAEMDHPDLTTNLVSGYDFINNDNEPWDDLGHGTHVASVIGGLTNNGVGTAGINWYVQIMPIKVLDSEGVGSVRHIIRGIEWAVEHGADVINLSLGSPDDSRALSEAVQRAVNDDGVIIVAASGNEFADGNPLSYPAAYDEVIAVGATDSDNNHASFSSGGEHLALSAPGIQILAATWSGSGSEYAYYTGTSMSAPIVAGVAGLVLSVDGSLLPSEVASILETTAQDVGQPDWDSLTGYGVVDAGEAVREANSRLPTPTMTSTPVPTFTPTSIPTSIPTATPTPTLKPTQRPTVTPLPTSTPTPESSESTSVDGISEFPEFSPGEGAYHIFLPLLNH